MNDTERLFDLQGKVEMLQLACMALIDSHPDRERVQQIMKAAHDHFDGMPASDADVGAMFSGMRIVARDLYDGAAIKSVLRKYGG